MTLELFKSKDGWRLRLRASNGKVLMGSEAYSAKRKAMQTAELIKLAAQLNGKLKIVEVEK